MSLTRGRWKEDGSELRAPIVGTGHHYLLQALNTGSAEPISQMRKPRMEMSISLRGVGLPAESGPHQARVFLTHLQDHTA